MRLSTKSRSRRKVGMWTYWSHCHAYCKSCGAGCLYGPEHARSHGAHHFRDCEHLGFFAPKICKRCREIEVRPDWDICRPCALLIELKQTRDFGQALRVARELFDLLPGGDGLTPPVP